MAEDYSLAYFLKLEDKIVRSALMLLESHGILTKRSRSKKWIEEVLVPKLDT